MKITFVIYHDVLEDRITDMMNAAGVDFYTEWENTKGKGHETIPHLGTRVYPGFNSVRMIAFEDESILEKIIVLIKELNGTINMKDDHIRLFQMPLERIV
ncbi:MAG: PG0541 family transporter-associated protein [Ignavibacteria bacterium]